MAEIDLRVRLDNVRLSFPHIAEPQVQKGDDGKDKSPKYNAEFILTPEHPGWARYFQVLQYVAQQRWKDKAQPILNFLQNERTKRKWGNGHEKIKKSTMQPYEGYVGMVYLGAASERMPQIFDAQGNLVPAENTMACKELARKMYGGCRVNAVIKPWCWDNKQGGSGVSNDFLAIQFLADDEPFGEGQTDASDLMGATPQAAQTPPVGFGPPGMPSAAPGVNWGVPGVQGAPMGMPPAPFPGAVPQSAAPANFFR